MIVRKTILLIKGALHFCIEKKCHPLFSNKIVSVLKGGWRFCTRKNAILGTKCEFKKSFDAIVLEANPGGSKQFSKKKKSRRKETYSGYVMSLVLYSTGVMSNPEQSM